MRCLRGSVWGSKRDGLEGFVELACALVARIKFFLLVKWLALRAGQRQGGVFRLPPPYLWTPLSPQRVKGCSPLSDPKGEVETEKSWPLR